MHIVSISGAEVDKLFGAVSSRDDFIPIARLTDLMVLVVNDQQP
jgi:hypothetical protein